MRNVDLQPRPPPVSLFVSVQSTFPWSPSTFHKKTPAAETHKSSNRGCQRAEHYLLRFLERSMKHYVTSHPQCPMRWRGTSPNFRPHTIGSPHRVSFFDAKCRKELRHISQRSNHPEFRRRMFIAPHLVCDRFGALVDHPCKRIT